MVKQKINLDINLFKKNLKYIVLGQLNKPVAFVSGWPVLTLGSMNSNDQIIFNDNDKSKADLLSAKVLDFFLINNARFINKSGITYVTAEFEEKYHAFNAIKNFPSDKINIGVLVKETDGKHTYSTEVISNISFVRGEFLCDPELLHKYSKIMKSAALEWNGYEKIWDYMVSKNWNSAIISQKNIIEYNKKSTEIINPKLEKKWKLRANKIFNELAINSINSHFIKDENQKKF